MSDAEWTPVLNGIPAPGNTFVLPEHKMVYVSVTKVACTSLRWMVADLVGEDLESFHTGLAAHETRLMTIHRNRTHWQKSPQLFEIPTSERGPISRDNGWLIFAVVRDPWSRLWSAWQSKFLVRHPYYLKHYGEADWFPRVSGTQKDVVEDFARFVFAAPWLSDERLAEDVHFRTQTYSVRPHGINYTRIYDLRRLDELFADIHTQLQGLGKDQELYLPRANETPLPMIPAVLEGGVAEAIERLYHEDFEELGDGWSLDRVKMKADSWTPDAIEHAAYHSVANERIADLSAQARSLEKQLARSEDRQEELAATVRELRARDRARLVRRVRRKVGRIVGRATTARTGAR
ncbi:MAG: sulfotransferase family 2 domain-containing protein [Marmoricola sp.]